MVFNAKSPFQVLKTFDTGPLTNHVNFVRNARGRFAYVTVGGLDEVLVLRTDTFEQVARIRVGELPHGIWPSGDGSRVYVGIENGDAMTAIDTLENKVVATIPIGQAAQAVVYVPNAVPTGDGVANLQPLGTAGQAAHLVLGPAGGAAATRVSLFDQGLTQVLQAAVTGLDAKTPYVLALSSDANGRRIARTAGRLHDESGRRRDRQRCRPHTPGRSEQRADSPTLPGHCARHVVRSRSRRAGPAMKNRARNRRR
jgi:DNA-binding beta-propeller fold protein YncE